MSAEDLKESLLQVDRSQTFISILSKSSLSDPACMAALGYAIVAGKPIFLLAERGLELSGYLLGIAREIEYYDKNDGASREAAANKLVMAMGRFLELKAKKR